MSNLAKINFIGCGRLGKTLARLIKEKNVGVIQDVYNKHYESSENAVQWIGAGHACKDINDLRSADIYFITTPDDEIESTCNQLVQHHQLHKNAIVLHCCGSLTSDILHAAKTAGAYIGSIHPIKSVANIETAVKTFAGTYCGFEGDQEIYSTIEQLIKKLGAHCFKIEKSQKLLYHIASVFASNYLVTLSYIAAECYKHAHVPAETSRFVIHQIMLETLKNIHASSYQEALTGPLGRGDVHTIAKHLDALKDLPDLEHLYRILAINTLPITHNDEDIKKKLLDLLESKSN